MIDAALSPEQIGLDQPREWPPDPLEDSRSPSSLKPPSRIGRPGDAAWVSPVGEHQRLRQIVGEPFPADPSARMA